MLHGPVTDLILGAFYKVYGLLDYGFLEKVYENAIVIKLVELGFKVTQQESINVHYKGVVVGDYFADIVVNNLIIIELKAAE